MVQSQQLKLLSTGEDMDAVLGEAVAFAENVKLQRKDLLHFRLLTEETMSMLRTLTGEIELRLSFYWENERCVIDVETDTFMDQKKREELLAVSSSGKNTAAKGIMGKVRDVFETAFLMPTGASWSDYCNASLMIGSYADVYSIGAMDAVYWSLSAYRSGVEDITDAPEHEEKWDELEKSIVSNIADDVQIGIKSGHVVLRIVYSPKGN